MKRVGRQYFAPLRPTTLCYKATSERLQRKGVLTSKLAPLYCATISSPPLWLYSSPRPALSARSCGFSPVLMKWSAGRLVLVGLPDEWRGCVGRQESGLRRVDQRAVERRRGLRRCIEKRLGVGG